MKITKKTTINIEDVSGKDDSISKLDFTIIGESQNSDTDFSPISYLKKTFELKKDSIVFSKSILTDIFNSASPEEVASISVYCSTSTISNSTQKGFRFKLIVNNQTTVVDTSLGTMVNFELFDYEYIPTEDIIDYIVEIDQDAIDTDVFVNLIFIITFK